MMTSTRGRRRSPGRGSRRGCRWCSGRSRRSISVASCRAEDRPQIAPPMNWLRAVIGLMMVPAAKARHDARHADLARRGMDPHLDEVGAEREGGDVLAAVAARHRRLALVQLRHAVGWQSRRNVLGIDLEAPRCARHRLGQVLACVRPVRRACRPPGCSVAGSAPWNGLSAVRRRPPPRRGGGPPRTPWRRRGRGRGVVGAAGDGHRRQVAVAQLHRHVVDADAERVGGGDRDVV